ncbi:F-box/LRR-repeat MAX2 homolog A [Rhodamnia argentea]|uniref:F-box/LRR-repeat MAX2 homolog A n=1 Tax=Rhodamnia argentea TaxID=178133 RepID=A0ABM3HN52_9MYRT|nr:F-box/LRR-repeat MAX2 homolog A [Rhodamnia argentea]
MARRYYATDIGDLPDAILSNIFSLVTDTRARNALSLVCRKYLALERATRVSLTLRGNVRNLYWIPTGFRRVEHLDLSLLSPWGHDLASSVSDPFLLAHRLRVAFPSVTSLTVYARSPATLQVLLPQWPRLCRVKLVRWHQRPAQSPLGADFEMLFEHCRSLSVLDLSSFYYYTEDLPPALQGYPSIASSLTRLDLLTTSFSEGFKTEEIRVIAGACGNLRELLVACTFDPRYFGFVGDQALLDIAANCPKLTLLHLVDTSSLANPRGDPEDDGLTSEDAGITRAALVEVFSKLSLLEELVLDVCRNVRESGFALEVLSSKCKNLRVLKLGQFHGVVMAIESQLDGLALCQGLTSLSIKNAADLTDMGLIEIARGCSKLRKFEIQGCKNVTWQGMRLLTSLLRPTLLDVRISCCKKIDAAASLRAVEPIRDRIQRLHIDCVWDGLEECEVAEPSVPSQNNEVMHFLGGSTYCEDTGRNKRCKYALDSQYSNAVINGNGFLCNSWERLQYLSLWIGVGDLLTPLPMAGLGDCPNLEEIHIKVEGDCRGKPKPAVHAFGLSMLSRYPALSKMQLDCGDAIGYVLTAPSGQMDLSLWERFFLNGIRDLSLNKLDYWPPQDRDVNQRSLSLPAAGLLAECLTLRKLFIHGTAHEHFMNFLLRIPNLRDVQLREDYYPAPENDMSTEMRVDSCSRFEDALSRQYIPD